MMIKALNITLGVLVALSVWCAAVMFTILAVHLLLLCGITAYHLLPS